MIARFTLLIAFGGLLSSVPPPPSGDLPIEIVSSDPPGGAIDARQSSNSDGSNPTGWSSLELTFTDDASGLAAGDFTVTSTSGTPPTVSSVVPNGVNATINLSDRIPPAAWSVIKHDPSVTQIVLGYLPGDVSNDGTSAPSDILFLIDCLVGVGTCEMSQCDADRSGACDPPDILRVIDLLNGAGAYDSWYGAALGPAPQQGPCTLGRKYAVVNKAAGGATGCAASIRTRNTVLCGEGVSSTLVASSNAWVGVTKYGTSGTPVKWAQIGYARDRMAGTTTILTRRYAETMAGPNMATDYELFVQNGVPAGVHEYRCFLLSPLFGTWTYDIDGVPFRTFTHNGWRNETGTHHSWTTEIFNREDQMVGTATSKCNYTDCEVSVNHGTFQNANILVGNLRTSDVNEWGIERVSATAFNVWGKKP